MRTSRVALALIVAGACGRASGHAQTSADAPIFDVVAIKLSLPETSPSRSANIVIQRPDGAEQRVAMLRAMLADRCQLRAHTERRELPSYDLVLDRKDGRLGSGLVPTDTDCEAINAARRAAATAPPAPFDPGNPPRCSIGGSIDQIYGEAPGCAAPIE